MTPDKLAEIKARHENAKQCHKDMVVAEGMKAHTDRADLLAYVETLTKERDEAREVADKHRDTVMMYVFGHQLQRDDFPEDSRIKNPWELKP